MKSLIAGYRAFMQKRWPEERAVYDTLAKKGQAPEYLVIACSDSRSDPATIFRAGPGELFVVRNVAAMVPPYEEGGGQHGTSAAIAFAVLKLNVRTILVMGHAQCGGVQAALNGMKGDKTPFLGPWVDLIAPAVSRCSGHGAVEAERETVKLSLENLMSFPFIAERVAAGTLTLEGARFGIADGVLEHLDKADGRFKPVPVD